MDYLGNNAAQHDTLWENVSGKSFVDVSEGLGGDFLHVGFQRGSAVGDLNDDGNLDLVVTSLNERPRILMNSGGSNNHWLLLEIRGTKANRDAIGATVTLTTESGRKLYNHVSTSVGFMSSSDKRTHFGLGQETSIKEIEIRWPGGAVRKLTSVRGSDPESGGTLGLYSAKGWQMPTCRVFLIVLDGVGIGAMPDAARFGDQHSNTLVNTARAVTALRVPFLQEMGLGHLASIPGVPPARRPSGAYGVMRETSAGKDTLTGHWELMQLVSANPFPLFPRGFPAALIKRFEEATGRGTLGNKPASGTAIIEELGPRHLATGYPIVYTSADSVFQLAAHTKVVPLDELYGLCRTARKLLVGEYGVARVIARPFTGSPGSFTRTSERRDFSLEPPGLTSLDRLATAARRVWGVGKIEDIFSGRGLTDSCHTRNNEETFSFLLELVERDFSGLVFANCGDFDTLYGHRNDPVGFALALSDADQHLGELFRKLGKNDLLIVTADHGCDPTIPGTDHSREHVPVIVAGPSARPGHLGTRSTFADVGATVEELLLGLSPGPGTSFAPQILL